MSWKHSFKRLNEEYEIANKKKQALDNLFETGKISQTTRDSFNNEIDAAVADIEKQQKELLAKMQFKMGSLETQIKTLEMLLANYEIQHVVGEIEEDTYQRETTVLSTGLETAKHELDVIIEAINQICPPAVPEATASPPQEGEVASPIEVPPVENAPIGPAEIEASPDLNPQEPAITLEETAPTPECSTAEADDVVSVETSPEDVTADETAEAEIAEGIPQESAMPVEGVAPENEQPQSEVEETAPVETLEAEQEYSQDPAETSGEAAPVEAPNEESTDDISIEEATEAAEDVNEEPVIITEEAAPDELSAENVDDASTEAVETAEPEVEEEFSSDEPLITVEDSAPETDKPSDESEDVLIIEAPQLADDGSEAVEVVPEANPQDASQEAQPEMTAEEAQPEIVVDETTAEEIVVDETTAEEIVADETTAEDLENSKE